VDGTHQRVGNLRHHRSTFNTLLAAYTGNSVDSLTTVASNDDIDPLNTNLLSRMTFNATGLSRYYVAIDGFNGDSGDSTLNWSLASGGALLASLAGLHPDQGALGAAGGGRAVLTCGFLPEGEFRISIAGRPLQRYGIEVSDDLAHWTPSVATVADISGLAYFTDKTTMHMNQPTAAGDPICGPGQIARAAFTPRVARFYRAVALPPD